MEKHDSKTMYKSTGHIAISSEKKKFVSKSFIWNLAQPTADTGNPQNGVGILTERSNTHFDPLTDSQQSVEMFRKNFSVEIYLETDWVNLNKAIYKNKVRLISADLFLVKSSGVYPYSLQTTQQFTSLDHIRIGQATENKKLHFNLEISPMGQNNFLGVKEAFQAHLLYWEEDLLYLNCTSPPTLFFDSFDKLQLRITPLNYKGEKSFHDHYTLLSDPLLLIDQSGVPFSLQEAFALEMIPLEQLHSHLSTFYSQASFPLYHRRWGGPFSSLGTIPGEEDSWVCLEGVICEDLLTQSLLLAATRTLWDKQIWSWGDWEMTVKDAIIGMYLDVSRFKWTDPISNNEVSLFEIFGFEEDWWCLDTLHLLRDVIFEGFFEGKTSRKICPYTTYCWDSYNILTFAYFAAQNEFDWMTTKNYFIDPTHFTKLTKKMNLKSAHPPQFVLSNQLLNSELVKSLVLLYNDQVIHIPIISFFCKYLLNFVEESQVLCDPNSQLAYFNYQAIDTFLEHLMETVDREMGIPVSHESLYQFKEGLIGLMGDVRKFRDFPYLSQTLTTLAEGVEMMEWTLKSSNSFANYIQEVEKVYWTFQSDAKSGSLQDLGRVGESLRMIMDEFSGSCGGIKSDFKDKVRGWGGRECWKDMMNNFFDNLTTSSFDAILSRYEGLAKYLEEMTHRKLSDKSNQIAERHATRLAQMKDRLDGHKSLVMILCKKGEGDHKIDSFLKEIDEAQRNVSDEFKKVEALKMEIDNLAKENSALDLKDLSNDTLAVLTTAQALLDLIADLSNLGRIRKEKELKDLESSKPAQELIFNIKKYLLSGAKVTEKLKCLKDNQSKLNKMIFQEDIANEELVSSWKGLKEDYLKKAKTAIEIDLTNLGAWFFKLNNKLSLELPEFAENEIKQYYKLKDQTVEKYAEAELVLASAEAYLSLEILEIGSVTLKRTQLLNQILISGDLMEKRYYVLKNDYVAENKLNVNFEVYPASDFDDLFEMCKQVDSNSVDLFCPIEGSWRIFTIQEKINKELKEAASSLEKSYLNTKGHHKGCRSIIENLNKESAKRELELQFLGTEFGPFWEKQQNCLKWIDNKFPLLRDHLSGDISWTEIPEIMAAQKKIKEEFELVEGKMTEVHSNLQKVFQVDEYNPLGHFRLLLEEACRQIGDKENLFDTVYKLESSIEEGIKLFSLNFESITEGMVPQMTNEMVEISAMLDNYERLLEMGNFEEDTQLRFEDTVFNWAEISGRFMEFKDNVLSTSENIGKMILDRLESVKQFAEVEEICSLFNGGHSSEIYSEHSMENLYWLYYLTRGHSEVLREEGKLANLTTITKMKTKLQFYNDCIGQLITSGVITKSGKLGDLKVCSRRDTSLFVNKINSFYEWIIRVEGLLKRDCKSVALDIYNEAIDKIGEVKEILQLGNQIETVCEELLVLTPKEIFRRWRALNYLATPNDQILKELELFVVEAENRLDILENEPNLNLLEKLMDDITEMQGYMRKELFVDINYDIMNKKLMQLHIKVEKKLAEQEMGTFLLREDEGQDEVVNWLLDIENFLISTNENLYGDLNTVKITVEHYENMRSDFESKAGILFRNPQSESMSDKQVVAIYERVKKLMAIRETNLRNALELAEELKNRVEYAKEVINVADQVLRVKPIYHNNEELFSVIQNHENFLEKLAEEEKKMNELKDIAGMIMRNINPKAVRFVKYNYTISCANWDQIVLKAEQRTDKLNVDFLKVKQNNSELEEVMKWLGDSKKLLAEKTKYDLPRDQTLLYQLLKEHEEFHDELISRYSSLNDIIEGSISSTIKKQKKGTNEKIYTLWKTVRKTSTEYLHSLQNAIDDSGRFENADSVDFASWRRRYQNWLRAKKLRILDFYRKNDSTEEGRITRERFVNGHIKAGLDSPRGELNAIFSLFGGPQCKDIPYKIIVDSILHGDLKPSRGETEELERGLSEELSKCSCQKRMKYRFISEGKYMIGNCVKYLKMTNGNLVVRVGGGWQILAEYIQSVDPCRSCDTLREARGLSSVSSLSKFVESNMKSYASEFGRKFGK